ncbi:MAG: hypothetical protein ACX93T_03420 [Bacteroidota bacterium]
MLQFNRGLYGVPMLWLAVVLSGCSQFMVNMEQEAWEARPLKRMRVNNSASNNDGDTPSHHAGLLGSNAAMDNEESDSLFMLSAQEMGQETENNQGVTASNANMGNWLRDPNALDRGEGGGLKCGCHE